jgi:hypothetical protein
LVIGVDMRENKKLRRVYSITSPLFDFFESLSLLRNTLCESLTCEANRSELLRWEIAP